MSDLRTAAQQALEAWDGGDTEWFKRAYTVMENLRAALAEPVAFDHGIGADRFKVVRGAFWWHVLIGDSPTEHGKFRSRASAEKMAADLLREFRNGAFVQHEAALAEPVQEPVAWVECDGDLVWNNREAAIGRNLYISPQPQQTEPSQDTPTQHEYEVTANDDGTFSVALPDGEELRIIPPQRPAEPVQQGCDYCNQPLYAAVKCRVCGRSHGAE